MSNRFNVDDKVWMPNGEDASYGIVISVLPNASPATARVMWENGNVATVWLADLLTDDEHKELTGGS